MAQYLHPSNFSLFTFGIVFTIALVLFLAVLIKYRDGTMSTGRLVFIRLHFQNAARDAGLGVMNKRQVTVMDSGNPKKQTVYEEKLPKITRGKMLPNNVGAEFRIKPASGRTLDDIARASEALAASLKVNSVRVDKETPYRGKLTVLFGNPLQETFHPD